ncbi:hypothetical protein [Aeromicrobium sp. UC242_57]|uniref:hypothetical protein n=1 Tax=Aeromicrobium sp. UC242_57 TaxID=3374624 RepID=UPI0037A396F0
MTSADPTFLELVLDDAPLAREGIDYRTVATLKQKIGADQAIYYGVNAEAGIAYGSISRPDGTSGLQPRDGFITDLKTQEMVRVSDGGSRPSPTQFTGMDYSDGRLVWVETDSDNLSASNWVMYAYQVEGSDGRGKGKTIELARAPKVESDPIPMASGSTVPQISGTDVYFNAVSKVSDKKVETSIYKVPIDGSSPLALFERGVDGVFADDKWVYFARGRDEVMRRSTREGSKAEPVRAMDQIRSWCGGGYANGLFVACANRAWTRALMIFDSNSRLLARIDVGKNDISTSTIDITGDLVGFDAGNKEEGDAQRYTFDVSDGSLVKLTDANVNTIAHGSKRIQQLRLQPDTGIANTFKFVEILPDK